MGQPQVMRAVDIDAAAGRCDAVADDEAAERGHDSVGAILADVEDAGRGVVRAGGRIGRDRNVWDTVVVAITVDRQVECDRELALGQEQRAAGEARRECDRVEVGIGVRERQGLAQRQIVCAAELLDGGGRAGRIEFVVKGGDEVVGHVAVPLVMRPSTS